MKIQLTKTKSIDWKPPWERKDTRILDIVGIEVNSNNAEGCPAVRLQRRKDAICVTYVGFIREPSEALPTSWDELRNQGKLSVPSALRADNAALAVNSSDAFTRQTSADPFMANLAQFPEGVAVSKDGTRSVFRRMADEGSVLQASIPEYQVLWLNRLLPEARRPTAISLQTTFSALLSSLSAQPGFCVDGDEAVVFVTDSTICLAAFRNGMPLLFRECPGAAGTAAMREAVKSSLGIDGAMLETVFANNGIIDMRPALEPLLAPVVSQIDLSLDYLKSRLGSEPKRIFLMGNAIGCGAFKRVVGDRISLPLTTPNPFDGLVLPTRSAGWKDTYCVGDSGATFLAALGAALAALSEESEATA